jgi:serpin B
VAVTNGSATVTFSLQGVSTLMEGRTLIVDGTKEEYRLLSLDEGDATGPTLPTGVLAREYEGPTNATASFTIKDDYDARALRRCFPPFYNQWPDNESPGSIDTDDPEGSRSRVNGWVSDQTQGLIPELLPAGFIQPTTVLVLTDTVYFKAQWRTVFGKYGPEDGEFTRLDGSTVDTSYLVELELPGPRGVGDGYVGAELPYLGDDHSMLVVVPDEGRFDEVRERLSTDLLDEIDATFTSGPFELRVPEWRTTTTIDLMEWLTDTGIAPGAFPGIGPGVFLDGAVHGADITVDETGTEAAAGTALGFLESGAPEPELVVAAERPYVFVIRHVESGAVLFAGQVTDPTA